MKTTVSLLILALLAGSCARRTEKKTGDRSESPTETISETGTRTPQAETDPQPTCPERKTPADIRIIRDLLYDRHTLEDTYPYRDTSRRFQWEKIRERLFFLDSIQTEPARWAVLQNYKNRNGEAPVVRRFRRNAYNRVSDSLGVERYQSVPLYLPEDTLTAERYGRDGWPVKQLGREGGFVRVATVAFPGEWLVPERYVHPLSDTVFFGKAVMIDRTNQNIATLEKADTAWIVRSMNPATTGVHNPPYAHETPEGLFLIQEKKVKMIYHRDGSTEIGGFAPYASRFTNGGYIHGVPVNAPRTGMIEFSPTLGTVPRSHMCVRNATSHAKFVYNWAPAEASVVFVYD